ncbi:hypothetical protein [Bacteroides sp. 224]|uniref:hypothetical protein n=1 Tax=Bacteroides sp. 224 TaxID=2302936 RepID=UPI0013D5A044|nr:hypothetical protein [Bacteroides sp. 224]NDV67135.1 hypothetical protein [Bacteroides sp. 224]
MNKFYALLLSVVLLSCGNKESKNKSVECNPEKKEYSQEYIDSLDAEREARWMKEKIESNKRHGIYRAIDTAYFGKIQIIIDSVVVKKMDTDPDRSASYRLSEITNDRLMGGERKTYDIYMLITNTSETQTLPLPFIFPDLTAAEVRMNTSSDGISLSWGSRFFFNTKTKKLQKDYDLRPGKSLRGFYHVISRKGKEIVVKYGDADEEDNDIPKGYENKEIVIDLSSMTKTEANSD